MKTVERNYMIEKEVRLNIHKNEIARQYGITEGNQLYEVEMYSYEHLLYMQKVGVKVDLDKINKRIEELESALYTLKFFIFDNSNAQIKEPNSAAQVALYYQSKGYIFPRTIKGNPQVNQETIQDVSVEIDLAKEILKYRKLLSNLSQLKSISKEVDSDGRVHPEYLSTNCATGRIYTKAPNIQGWGEDAKSFIIPDEGYTLLEVDYKSEELRIIAALSNCTSMLKAFEEGVDLHSFTYSMMNNIPIEEVTKDQRAIGKVLNFATIYGQTPEGLALELKIPVDKAQTLQNLYFRTYPEIKSWLSNIVREARKNGFVTTPWGRKRNINFNYDSSKADRQAMNTPIQGAGADIIKLALKNLYGTCERMNVLTTIHDSLIVEYRNDMTREQAEGWLRSVMEIDFCGVKLEVDFK